MRASRGSEFVRKAATVPVFMVTGDDIALGHFDALGAGHYLDTVADMGAVEGFFRRSAGGSPQDARRNLRFALVVQQGTEAKMAQFILGKIQGAAQQQRQHHDVERTESHIAFFEFLDDQVDCHTLGTDQAVDHLVGQLPAAGMRLRGAARESFENVAGCCGVLCVLALPARQRLALSPQTFQALAFFVQHAGQRGVAEILLVRLQGRGRLG